MAYMVPACLFQDNTVPLQSVDLDFISFLSYERKLLDESIVKNTLAQTVVPDVKVTSTGITTAVMHDKE